VLQQQEHVDVPCVIKIWVVTNYIAVKSRWGETPTETWCCLWTLKFWLNKLCTGAA